MAHCRSTTPHRVSCYHRLLGHHLAFIALLNGLHTWLGGDSQQELELMLGLMKGAPRAMQQYMRSPPPNVAGSQQLNIAELEVYGMYMSGEHVSGL